MSSKFYGQAPSTKPGRILTDKVVGVTWDGSGGFAWYALSKGSPASGACVRCPSPPCLEMTDAEVSSGPSFFPHDTTPEVCPTGALTLLPAGSPHVVASRCIGCGLCALRCPFGAISIAGGTAAVNDSENQAFADAGRAITPAEQARMASFVRRTAKQRALLTGGEMTRVAELAERIRNTKDVSATLLVRNLMLTMGVPWRTRRRGDQNIRVDAVFLDGKRTGVAEVEFTETAAVESPRALLESVAVLCSRHKVPVGSMEPLIVMLTLPNKRSEYWRVIADAKKVLGVELRSVTVGALCTVAWERGRVRIEALYADDVNRSIEDAVAAMLGRKFGAVAPGVLAPEK